MKFKVLSIDAWADCCGCEHDTDEQACWTWNNWFSFGEYDSEEFGELNKENARKYFASQMTEPEKFSDYYETEDDQYNLVLIRSASRMPILAIEYGSHE
jgi:hypothetical protein